MSNDTTDQSAADGFNSMLMTAAAVGLFLIVAVVSLALRLYARCIYRWQASSRAMSHQLAQLASAAAQVQHLHNRPKAGLDPTVIAALPAFTYRCGSRLAVDCAVCLSALEEDEVARALPKCMHIFHAECIDMWLYSHSTCPICRVQAVAHAQMEQPTLISAS